MLYVGKTEEDHLMKRQTILIWAATAFIFTIATYSSAAALTMKECSAKYKAAQTAGTLNGMKWADFRKAECGATTAAAPAAAPAAAAPATAPATATRTAPARTTTGSAPSAPSAAVFPNAVSSKYSSEKPGEARMHTCVDQYNANKTANANGGLIWIEKGGGYWSECIKRLMG